MLKKLIHTLYYILFLATPLIIFSKTSEIFEFNKMIFIYLMTLLITGVWCIQFILQDRPRPKLSIFHWVILAFVATQILSTVFSIDHHTSIFGYYGRFNGGLLSTLAYAALLFILISEATLPFIKNLLKFSLLSSVIVMIWGLPGKFNFDLTCGIFTGTFDNSCWTNQFQPNERMFSTLGQPNWLGAYMAVNFFIGLYFYLRTSFESKKEASSSHKMLYLIYSLCAFITVLFTRSRSSLAAVVIGLVVLFLLLLYRKKSLFTPLFKRICIFVVLLAVASILFKTGVEKIDKYLPFQSAKKVSVSIQKPTAPPQQNLNITDSFDIRKIVWKGAWLLALRYPLFGSGVETFAYSYYFTRPVEHNTTSEWDFLYNKAHNEFVNYLATTGFIGFAAYMVMIGAVFVLFWKQYTKKSQDVDYLMLLVCTFAAYVTILVTNFFGFSTTTISLFFYILPVIFLVKESKTEQLKTKKLSLLRKTYLGFVVAFMVFGLYFVMSYWVADYNYAVAQTDMRNGRYSEAAYKLIHILKYHYEHVYEDKLSLALIGTALGTDTKKDIDQFTLTSEYFNNRALLASPYNILYWKSRATIFYNLYQLNSDPKDLEKAIDATQTAEKIAPTDPRSYYTAAQYALILSDVEKKAMYLKMANNEVGTALLLKPDYDDAIVLKKSLSTK